MGPGGRKEERHKVKVTEGLSWKFVELLDEAAEGRVNEFFVDFGSGDPS